ncbi:MAG: VOC family protein [Chitinophagaceae bacterium]
MISEDIYAMILTEEFFKTFIPNKEISDSTKSTEAIVALSAESKEKVNELTDKALAAGASKLREPDDYGFMYSRSFQDPDGHIWEVVYMDMNAFNEQQENTKHEQTV